MGRPAPSEQFFDRESLLLGGIVLVALAARVWFLTDGVPFAVGIDEPAIVDRALRILRTGDWNTHIFDYPPLVIYLHAVVFVIRFLAGAVRGEWGSLDTLNIAAVYTAGRLVAAVIGAATVAVVYGMGRELGSPVMGLLAAAQLAVMPMHVRESHFILTDVPVTALTAVAVWMAVRAVESRQPRFYLCAGIASGLAAAAKYNGAVAIVSIVGAWAADRRRWHRLHDIGVALGAALLAYLLVAPYTVLDLPAFLNGFAAQASRFAATRVRGGDPVWLLYAKHLSLAGWWWLPIAIFGAAAAIVPRRFGRRWVPVLAFVAAYWYVLASRPLVFGRYALPLVPMICLLAANGAVAAIAIVRQMAPRRAYIGPVATTAAALVLTVSFAIQSVVWLDQLRHQDTRDLAAEWLIANLGPGTRLVVENSGPTYLGAAGFSVGTVELIMDQPLKTYLKEGVEYLVISSAAGHADPAYARGGPVVYQVSPSRERWGPPIEIVKLAPSNVPSAQPQ